MSERGGPTRRSDSLADVVEMLLDKGVVINADIAVSVGDTELLGVQLRAALASFETAAEYGLEFPDGTDMRRVEAASDRTPVEELDDERDEPVINESGSWLSEPPITSDESESDDHAKPPSQPGVGARPRVGERSDVETDENEDGDDGDDEPDETGEGSDDED
ncbi:gas vesicle protein GvpJ [Halococcus saccharolyticus]|uniref:Gas vesicle protein GvpA n=1 Tax=Halococcus saccharolyticus DSM 5350 TaxID=1227455 RepID=M0MP96_9EURY|nr:gas vesicle protein [Halococcus saccharolyticus]EMA46539.1 gas vesicle protein GvpA [Halococcus saccharolyticus DSM 5350]